jgi:hypothetical protein
MPPRRPVPRVITSAGLAIADIPNDHAEREVAEKRWLRGARGVYLTHAGPASDAELCQIARAHVGEEFIVTGLVILRAFGLPWLPTDPRIHVLVPPESRRTSSVLVRVTRTSSYNSLETWTRHGSRFAEAGCATIDAARSSKTLQEVRGIVLGAVARRRATVEELTAYVEAGQRNGSALVRRAVADAARGCASPPEAELVDELIGRGRPFYVNPQIWLDGVLLGSTDVWLVGTGTGGEVDSQERHGDEVGVENTYDRHERITTPGLQLVHLSVARIRRNVTEAADHLLARARTGPPQLAGLVIVPQGPLLR